jgi:hypothetical protein
MLDDLSGGAARMPHRSKPLYVDFVLIQPG